MCPILTSTFVSTVGLMESKINIIHPCDSTWPFHPLVGGRLSIQKSHLTIPKGSQRIARMICILFLFAPNYPKLLQFWTNDCGQYQECEELCFRSCTMLKCLYTTLIIVGGFKCRVRFVHNFIRPSEHRLIHVGLSSRYLTHGYPKWWS